MKYAFKRLRTGDAPIRADSELDAMEETAGIWLASECIHVRVTLAAAFWCSFVNYITPQPL